MVALFTADQFRRVITEAGIPYLLQWWSHRGEKRQDALAKKNDDSPSSATGKTLLERELGKDEHELFDDYLEMVTQFGYIVLFASSFPLGFAISMVSNFVEIRSDAFKLSFVCRRPRVCPAKNAGVWEAILVITVWTAVFTNTFVFGVASDQMAVWFPHLFQGNTTCTP